MKRLKAMPIAAMLIALLCLFSVGATAVSAASPNETKIATYSTHFSVTKANSNRNYNIQKALASINGVIIEPGQTFNWHQRVGASSRSDGYLLAPVISGGETVMGYGGGICQVSSTLFAATQQTVGLFPVERKPHGKAVGYLPRELEATVSYPVQNFIFRNDRECSVRIEGIYDPAGNATINIYEISKSGWQLDYRGWWYLTDQKSYPKSQWQEIDSQWYYFDQLGYMHTGWWLENDKWYYLTPSGAMAKGWRQDTMGIWYFFHQDGSMNTGWMLDHARGKWYYLSETVGVMATGWRQMDNNNWYYFDQSGEMVTGWQNIADRWFCFKSNGEMLMDTYTPEGQYLGVDGVLVGPISAPLQTDQ